ncbi:protein NUCLEAR FUSION DEFECTIVE 6, mitochondrial isoform X2 [Diospyros lotus]|uniref:protein NUCLEAR FUSION DEFECTIVE 6, mitochondrial isoform X2 n=1 Tax=Diospyros lotus TaxID=55363 RepID=UPI002256094D|nr:protein NUCLEAR FUSION DEFECTIVE 6, mitochondrial isoform X2 [Diospyros lotus]
MASNSARSLFQRSTASARSIMSRNRTVQSPPSSVASKQSNLGGLAPSNPAAPSRFSRRHNLFFSTRLPVELSGGESLIPLHSATASALLRSMLSAKVSQWGCVSEGFATPL